MGAAMRSTFTNKSLYTHDRLALPPLFNKARSIHPTTVNAMSQAPAQGTAETPIAEHLPIAVPTLTADVDV